MEPQSRRRRQYTDNTIGNVDIVPSRAEVQATEEPAKDLRRSAAVSRSDDVDNEDTASEGYSTPRYGSYQDRKTLLADIEAYFYYKAAVSIAEIEKVFAALKEAALHIEDADDEDIIEWVDPIPGWEPQEHGPPLWQQCLRDDVTAILPMPKWPLESLTWDEYDHYCVRNSIVEIVVPDTLPEDDKKCPICYEPFDDCKKGPWEEKHLAVKVTCQGKHLIGSTCLYQWFRSLSTDSVHGCPLCRDKLVEPPAQEPQHTLEDLLDIVEENGILPIWALQYYSDIARWFPFELDQLREELKFIYQILADRIDLHMPVDYLAECRERARIVMRMLVEHLPDCPLTRHCRQSAFAEYETPEYIRDWTVERRREENTFLVQNLWCTVRSYVKTMDKPDRDPWDLFSAEQIKTGAMDGYGKEFWLRVVNAALHSTRVLQRAKHFGHQGEWGYILRHDLHEREKLQKIGLFRFLFRHDDSFDQVTMGLFLKKISLHDLGVLLRQTEMTSLEDFYKTVRSQRAEPKAELPA
jgi:hypothetical protein